MEKLRLRVGIGVLKCCLFGISLHSRGHPPRKRQEGYLVPPDVSIRVARQWGNKHKEMLFFLLSV